jgi:two-component system, OmpR family, phosphate regulon sensor histidine kinase PhoR
MAMATAPAADGLIAAFPHPAALITAAGDIHTANAALTAIFPLARSGEPAAFAFRNPEVRSALNGAAQGEARRFEISERTPVPRAFDAHALPLGDGFTLLVMEDLTERRRVERMRVDFIANASHELRTPLSSLLGFVETLRGSARDDAVARSQFLGIMEEQARRMARLIDDLLSLSRIEMQAHLQPSGSVVLRDCAQQIIDGFRIRAREAGVELLLEAPQEPLLVRGDPDELLRVFENLIENAIRYGASGERVVVSMGGAGEGKAFATVRDFGAGIAPDHVPRLTERFYRTDVAASRSSGGTGLGLAIVKHIMLRHRGRLDIESAPGRGSAFTITLPRID